MPRSNKTSHVLKLVSQGEGIKTPAENKSAETQAQTRTRRIIKSAEAKKLTQKPPLNPALRTAETAAANKRLVHIPTELLNEQLLQTLKRFNVCSCKTCVTIITEKTISELPNRFIKTGEGDDALQQALDEMRPAFLKILAKICITAKNKPLHDE